MADLMEAVTSLAKRRGIAFQSSEIYGGLRSSWDYGPLGVELQAQHQAAVVALDGPAPRRRRRAGRRDHHVARRSGRRAATSRCSTDPLVECLNCHQRFREDHLGDDRHVCPNCGQTALHRAAAVQPDVQDAHGPGRGRGERGRTCGPRRRRGCSSTSRTIQQASPQEDPVRDRADRQVVPQRDHAGQLHLPHARVRADGDGVLRRAGHRRGVARVLDRRADAVVRRPRDPQGEPAAARRTSADELAHYAKRTVDIEYEFPFTDWGELEGIANRTDFDLKAHQEASGEDLTYFDQEKEQRYLPYVIEPAAGVDRACSPFLLDAYREEEAPTAKGGTEKRTYLALHRDLAPIKVAVLPLSRNERLTPEARRRVRPRQAARGCATSTTPARSAGATAARTRSGRRSA